MTKRVVKAIFRSTPPQKSMERSFILVWDDDGDESVRGLVTHRMSITFDLGDQIMQGFLRGLLENMHPLKT